jgi:hydroxyethylthiazole kinase-like uncharacterized protein yjeF
VEFPKRNALAKKGDAGKVLVIGGSRYIHGAPILCGLGALSAGVDLVTVSLPNRHTVVARCKETNFFVREFLGDEFILEDAEQCAEYAKDHTDAVVIGCGFLEDAIPSVLRFLSRCSMPIVIDAGALQKEVLPPIQNRKNVLLTPHGGEFARVFECEDTQENVQKMANKWGITILKKGMKDIIASSDETAANTTGCAEMSVGGTGDCLAGICGGLLAQGVSPFEAAKTAAHFWGKAGEKIAQKKRVISAEDILEELKKEAEVEFSSLHINSSSPAAGAPR